jgi:hypothetical protein
MLATVYPLNVGTGHKWTAEQIANSVALKLLVGLLKTISFGPKSVARWRISWRGRNRRYQIREVGLGSLDSNCTNRLFASLAMEFTLS